MRKANTAWAWGLPAAVIVFALALAGWSASPLIAQAGTLGQWRTLINQLQINPVHVALMNTGQVLIVSGSGNVATEINFQSAVWDPSSETFQPRPLTAWDMFCNGMVVLHDGRVFINGGNLQYDPFFGEPRNAVYNPATGLFSDVESMAHGRWYPTTTTLGDGSVMTFSGLRETGGTNTSVEIYTVGAGWSQEYPAGWTPPLYPRMHLSTDGRVFYSGSTRSSRFFNPSTKTWSAIVATTNYTGTRSYGTSVLLPLTPANGYRPRVMIFGGGNPGTATTEIIDLSAATPLWQYGPSMSRPRIQMNATILPNGKVLATGGSTNDEDAVTASLNADIYDPVANTFSSGGANVHPRLYHSNSLLLPDATVLLIGGNPQRGNYERRLEIYSPAYLFNTNGTLAVRPTITTVTPGTINYGAAFQVQTPNAAQIASVVLVRPGTPTHAFDMEQRLVGLSYTAGSGVLNVTAPPNGNIAPPGYYMLFVLNTAGVPSVARFVRLTTSAPNQAPVATITSPASDVTRNPGGTVSFSGTGSDPDGSISAYAWTFPGGAPASSAVASPGNVTYSTPGTYVASFQVTDNQGLASQPATRTVTVTVVPATGVVAEWGFNEGSGTTLGDDSGNGHPGTITGATWTTGRYGGGLNFDGNDLVTLGDLDLSGSFTVMAWLQTRSLFPNGCGSLVMKAYDYGFEICHSSLYAGVGANNTFTAYVSQPLTSADLNVWKHVALTHDGTTLRFYIGGTLVTSAPGAHSSNNHPLLFGRWTSDTEFWNGLIDEVRIYDRALNQTEIQTALATPIGVVTGTPPTLANPGNQKHAEGNIVSLPLSATDPDSAPITFSASGLPQGLSINQATGVISGTLTYLSAGIHTVTVTATAGGQSDSEVFSWTVMNTNRPPVLVNPGDRSNAEGATASLQLVATDPDGDAVTLTASGLPPALATNPSTGQISGTLSAGSIGSYSVTATAWDGALAAGVVFTWTVAPASTAPTVSLTAPAPGTVAGTVMIRATASDDVGVLGVQFFVNGAPLGVEDTGAPYEVAWNTQADTNGPKTLTATARDGAGNLITSVPLNVSVANAVGLVAAWGFNEGTGVSLGDGSGNGHTGSITGATWVTGRFGQALNFDGNDMVTLDDLDLSGPFTVMAWMQTRTVLAGGGCASLVMKALDYGFEICEGRLYAGVGSGSAWTAYVSTALTTADLNVWKHVALTYDGTTLRFYIGGTLITSATGAHSATNDVLRFGRWSSNIEFWNGLIDEVRVYSNARTQAQIQTDLNTPVGP